MTPPPVAPPPAAPAAAPPPVTLDLREGFAGDEVLVQAPGLADLHLPAVRTRLQTGRAHSLVLPGGADWVCVSLPQRGLRCTVALAAGRPLWLGVSVSRDGRDLLVQQQAEPFGYV